MALLCSLNPLASSPLFCMTSTFTIPASSSYMPLRRCGINPSRVCKFGQIIATRRSEVILKSISLYDGEGTDYGGETSESDHGDDEEEEEVLVDDNNLLLDAKLQQRLERKMRMKLSKKMRLRRKKLVRKRRMRRRGQWPPSKSRRLKRV